MDAAWFFHAAPVGRSHVAHACREKIAGLAVVQVETSLAGEDVVFPPLNSKSSVAGRSITPQRQPRLNLTTGNANAERAKRHQTRCY